MIYWTKKNIKKNSFQEISKYFIKNDFELMISIYLFTKNNQFILSISFAFNFEKELFTYQKIFIWQQKIFLFAFIENERIFTILFTKVFQFVFI